MDLHIAGVGAYLPPGRGVADAVAAGEYDAESAERDGLASACVEPRLGPPAMAARAAEEALEEAAGRYERLTASFYACIDFQGARYWQAAPYVAAATGHPDVPAFDVVQECNGMLACLELAGRYVREPGDAVLISSGDRFDHPWVRRWYADQSILGDGGAAVVVSGTPGAARILSIATTSDYALEAEARGGTFIRGDDLSVVDFDQARRDFWASTVPMLEHYARLDAAVRSCVGEALDRAATTASELAFAVPVVTTSWRTRIQLERYLGLGLERSTWDFGRTTGHVGTADQVLGLHHLLRRGRVRAGDRVLLLGGGTGFTVTAAVLEISEDPV
ncbi:ketoacyl-ACP synthase III family protein [Clavibacter tessellarius]|uniref:ketoacyl-ACP synthase III family protein n=1 Tax=Clavibacter tessellarius TaxID=31965 RepID=UPI0039E7EE0D